MQAPFKMIFPCHRHSAVYGFFGVTLLASILFLLDGKWIPSVCMLVPLYIELTFLTAKYTFLDDCVVVTSPLNPLPKKQKKVHGYKDIVRIKASSFINRHGERAEREHYIEFKFRRDEFDVNVTSGNMLKIVHLLAFMIDKRMPVFVANDTPLLQQVNGRIKQLLGKEIDTVSQVTEQHKFFFLKNRRKEKR